VIGFIKRQLRPLDAVALHFQLNQMSRLISLLVIGVATTAQGYNVMIWDFVVTGTVGSMISCVRDMNTTRGTFSSLEKAIVKILVQNSHSLRSSPSLCSSPSASWFLLSCIDEDK
jgi:hypothetical protein